MNKHFKNFAESGAYVVEHIEFTSTKHLTSLAQYHHDGGTIPEIGIPIWLERNARTKLIPATLLRWTIGSVIYDLTGWGKYAASSIDVLREDGKKETWPISMAYLR